jgi:hypothetical protein
VPQWLYLLILLRVAGEPIWLAGQGKHLAAVTSRIATESELLSPVPNGKPS